MCIYDYVVLYIYIYIYLLLLSAKHEKKAFAEAQGKNSTMHIDDFSCGVGDYYYS